MHSHLDLCSGIGGFALGLQNTGYFKTSAFCEIDSYCHKVLNKNFPDIPIYSDIREFSPTKENINPFIITSGFPCQPFSVAGRQKGKDDNRNLWKETFRIIKESKPTWFIGENVSGIVRMYLDTILEDLESANYSTRCFIISAQSIGAKHERERIWIISDSNYARRKEQWQSLTNEKKHETFKCSNWWEIESKLCGTPYGLSTGLDKDRVKRIKGLGNAIVPQIPFYIGQAIGRLYE